jgi:hypothetical protein
MDTAIDIAIPDNGAKLNVDPNCEAAAQGAVVAGRHKQACLEDEQGHTSGDCEKMVSISSGGQTAMWYLDKQGWSPELR